MPKLRRLSGLEVIKILEAFGFEVVRVKGSHHVMQRTVKATDENGKEYSENRR
jgi:predicted RNA binding protein YcfA (HicA-like mRNA interferase family)